MKTANSHKQHLRRQFLHQRQALSVESWQMQSDLLCSHLANCPEFIQAQTVGGYQSDRQEPNLDSLFMTTDKQWGLPRCVGKDLHWHCWQPLEPLVSGAHGILEPSPELPTLTADRIDLLLIPAVAIDAHGYRLGYGGGYYDRLRADPWWRRIPTIGIVFDLNYVETLPIDPWDLPIDKVCTELGITSSLGRK
jgi:5-formyltetrahydrofolate cyclo-ligase